MAPARPDPFSYALLLSFLGTWARLPHIQPLPTPDVCQHWTWALPPLGTYSFLKTVPCRFPTPSHDLLDFRSCPLLVLDPDVSLLCWAPLSCCPGSWTQKNSVPSSHQCRKLDQLQPRPPGSFPPCTPHELSMPSPSSLPLSSCHATISPQPCSSHPWPWSQQSDF